MANYNPWQARMKRWQQRWPVPIEEIQAQAYGVLMMAYENVIVEDAEQRRKNITCYFQGLAAFARLLDAHEYERRLRALEALAATNGHADISRN
jgi:hypothetical protein